MPRDVPPTSSITPLRASACRCSSAALAERKPSSAAISARVGGAPVRSMALCTRSRICCWRAVSLGFLPWASWVRLASGDAEHLSSGCIFIQISQKCKASREQGRDPGHGWHDRRHRGASGRQRRLQRRPARRRRSSSRRCPRCPTCRSSASRSRRSTARTWTSPSGSALAARVAHHLARRRRGGHRHHPRHRHAGRDRLPAAPRAGAGQAGGAHGRDAPGDVAAGRRPAEPARAVAVAHERRRARRAWW